MQPGSVLQLTLKKETTMREITKRTLLAIGLTAVVQAHAAPKVLRP